MKLKSILPCLALALTLSHCSNPEANKGKPLSPRLNHVMLSVSDLNRSIAFYTKAFDLRVTNQLDTLIAVQPDGTDLIRPVRMAWLKFPGQDFVFEMVQQIADTTRRPATYSYQHVGVDVQDIGTAYQRAVEAGAKELVPVRMVRAKGIKAKQAFLGGPDGERIELMQMISGEF